MLIQLIAAEVAMASNLDRFRRDLDALIGEGEILSLAMLYLCAPQRFSKFSAKDIESVKKKSNRFGNDYEVWYSESRAVISAILPDRLNDFVCHYKRDAKRKELTAENYVMEDFFQGLERQSPLAMEKVAAPSQAIPRFEQQLRILKAARRRFETSLYDIKQIVQADIFDSELDSAKELNKKGFHRAAGAVAGVVLEKHLSLLCSNHKITLRKSNPTINDLNGLLKQNNVIEVTTWRRIQHLADIRNLCDHSKSRDPRSEEVEDLILGVESIVKTLF